MTHRETVYAVLQPIPHLGAVPGDELIVRPTDPDFPMTLLRVYDASMIGRFPSVAVCAIHASIESDEDPVPPLRLV